MLRAGVRGPHLGRGLALPRTICGDRVHVARLVSDRASFAGAGMAILRRLSGAAGRAPLGPEQDEQFDRRGPGVAEPVRDMRVTRLARVDSWPPSTNGSLPPLVAFAALRAGSAGPVALKMISLSAWVPPAALQARQGALGNSRHQWPGPPESGRDGGASAEVPAQGRQRGVEIVVHSGHPCRLGNEEYKHRTRLRRPP